MAPKRTFTIDLADVGFGPILLQKLIALPDVAISPEIRGFAT
jgi:hypothetical protein